MWDFGNGSPSSVKARLDAVLWLRTYRQSLLVSRCIALIKKSTRVRMVVRMADGGDDNIHAVIGEVNSSEGRRFGFWKEGTLGNGVRCSRGRRHQ